MRASSFGLGLLMSMAAPLVHAEGTVSAEFLKFGVGARYLGMGSAATSIADDATAVYWNPANLGYLSTGQVTLMQADMLANGKYSFAGVGLPVKKVGGLALGVQSATVGELNSTDEAGNPLGNIEPRDTSLSIGWGKSVAPGWAVGLGGQWINSTIVHTANAFSMDLGGLFTRGAFKAGLSFRQGIATSLQYDQEKSPLPRVIQGGASYKWNSRWLAAADLNSTRGSALVFGTGLEYGHPLSLRQMFFLRAGYQTRPGDLPGFQGVSMGVGWRWDFLDLDYAFIPMGEVDDTQTHRFSMGVRFGGPAPKTEAPQAPEPADDDADGVTDGIDRCPGTPATVAVDEMGCPVDSDRDGVPDHKDQCPGTIPGIPVDPTGCVTEIIRQLPKRTTFGFDDASVDPELKPWLNRFGMLLLENPSLDGLIEGHADSLGAADYNRDLSVRRAQAVKEFILESGDLSEERLLVIGHGEEKPMTLNETVEGRRLNRRVEITIILRRPIEEVPPKPE